MKAFTLTLCIGSSLIKACSSIMPSINTNNGISKFETHEIIAYSYEDERCEVNKHSGTYTYSMHGFPPSTKQAHFQRRFEVLKQKFEEKK